MTRPLAEVFCPSENKDQRTHFSEPVLDDRKSELCPKGVNLRPVEVPVSTNSSSRIIRFSTFEVNLQTGELRQRGQKVKFQEQPFQLLVALFEEPGKVVTREELRSKLWPADTFVDFDHGLNVAIKRLRDALGESAERPIFVEALADRGYRFISRGCYLLRKVLQRANTFVSMHRRPI
jgi:DNA-binding winged helix-turn-helix (wHTH) protein